MKFGVYVSQLNVEDVIQGIIMRFLIVSLAFVSFLISFSGIVFAQEGGVLKRYQDWTVYRVKSKDGQLCFAASTPKDTVPKGLNRGDAYFYVTTWPKFKVSEEVSIKMGYPLKKSSAPTATIGAKNFTLYESGDKAYIHSSLESELLSAMRSGQKMVIKATSKRGKKVTDVYSLSGITAAMKAALKACK